MNKYLKFSLFSGALVLLGFIFLPSQASASTLSVSPTSNSVTVGTNFTVNIVLNTTGQAVAGVDVYSLRFNPAVLQVVDADGSASGVQITPGTLMPTNQYNVVNNSAGTIQFSQISSTSGTNFNGSGNLATINFATIGVGNSTLNFDFTPGSTVDTNVAVLYSDSLTSVTNGSYTVNSAPDTTAPSTPATVTASPTSSTAMNVTWTASTDNSGTISGYQVFRCTGASCTPTVQIATSTSLSYADSGLTAVTTYRYRVRAVDPSNNVSGFSTIATGTTTAAPDTTAPVISAVTASAITQTAATITWTTNETSDTQVNYGLSTAYGSSSSLVATQVTSHTVNLSGLSAGTPYHYRVNSRDGANNLATSGDFTFTTLFFPDTTAPTVAITNPATSGQTVAGSITFSATASDPVVAGQTNSGIFSLSLLIDGTVFASSTSGSLSRTLDTTTVTNNTHTLTAVARDNAGNITNSSSVSIIVFNLSTATRFPRKIALTSLEGRSSVPGGQPLTALVIGPTTGAVLSTQPLTPDVSSNYTVAFQTSFPQIVNIRASVTGYLTRLLSNVDTTIDSASAMLIPQLVAGDFNSDNLINSLDYSTMNTNWNQNFALADINRDGLVNSLDYAVLKNNFNRTGE